MDSVFFAFLSSIEPWMWFAAAVVLLPIAASIGEVTILPWISLALVFVGIADIFVFSVEIQLVTFCLVFFSSIVLSHRFLSSDTNQPLIAEGVGDMVGRELKITSIDPTNLFSGTAGGERVPHRLLSGPTVVLANVFTSLTADEFTVNGPKVSTILSTLLQRLGSLQRL